MTEDTAPHPAAAPLPCDALAAERTLIMGILNVTPDSFSDGGHRPCRPHDCRGRLHHRHWR